jgi:NitT/TauT family transport system permease protein
MTTLTGLQSAGSVNRARRDTTISALFWLALLGSWQLYSTQVPAYQLPGPLVVGQSMLAFITDPLLARELGVTIFHILAAILISFLVGGSIAFLPSAAPVTRLLVDGRITPFLNSFSGLGWLFLAILWFGINSVTVIFTVSVVLIPFAIINLRTGLQEMDRDLTELGRSLSRSRLRHFVKLTVPMMLPYVFTTLRTSFGVSWKVVLTSELFGGSSGIGYILNVAWQRFDTPMVFAVIVYIVVFVAFAEHFFFRPIQKAIGGRNGNG